MLCAAAPAPAVLRGLGLLLLGGGRVIDTAESNLKASVINVTLYICSEHTSCMILQNITSTCDHTLLLLNFDYRSHIFSPIQILYAFPFCH